MILDAQLLKWSQTSNGGFTATFAFSDEDAAREYFQTKTLAKGKQAGQLFSMSFEELDEHGNTPTPVPRRFQGGPLARLAIVTWGKDRLFWDWLCVDNEDAAATKVKALCGVESRNEIDADPRAVKLFHQNIRIPYQQWLAQQYSEEAAA